MSQTQSSLLIFTVDPKLFKDTKKKYAMFDLTSPNKELEQADTEHI